MPSLRLAMVTTYWLASTGGPVTYMYHLSQALRRRGHEVFILAGEAGDGALQFSLRPGRRELEIFGHLRRIRPDIVHLQGRVHFIPPAWAYRVWSGTRVPLVFTQQTQPYVGRFLDLPQDSRPDYPGLKRHAARFLLGRCAAVTAVSQSIFDNLNTHYHLGISQGRVIYNGAALAPVNEARLAQLKETYGLKSAFPVLSTIGVLTWDWKVAGHLICLKAVARLRERYPRLKLLIAGDGVHREFLVEEIRRLGLGDQVVLLGNYPHIPELLAATDIYVHMALLEACPLAVLEAMQAGRPIVAARRGGIPEIVANGDTGRLIEPEPEELALTLTELLEDEKQRRRLAAQAHAYWERHLRWETVAARYEALYYEVLGQGHPHGQA